MNQNVLHLFATRDHSGLFLWTRRPRWCPVSELFYNGGEVLTMSLWDGAFPELPLGGCMPAEVRLAAGHLVATAHDERRDAACTE